MKLRKLKEKDAPFMLEWIRDENINCFFQFDAESMNLDSVKTYIQEAQEYGKNRHYAVTDQHDEYLGTISLKNINKKDSNAEYAVAMRSKAMGTGVALEATRELIRIAFEELGLIKVYLNVYEDNIRARKFYEKAGFIYEGTFKKHVKLKGNYKNLCWYAYFKEE